MEVNPTPNIKKRDKFIRPLQPNPWERSTPKNFTQHLTAFPS